MKNILLQNENYIVAYDNIKYQGKYWLELIHKPSGMAQIIVCDTKKQAANFFKGCTIEKAIQFITEWKIEPVKMYKENANFNI